MTITIKAHSLVDIITNSSTVIFTWADGNAEAMVLELIDEVLAVAGSDKKAAELYDVRVQVSDMDSLIDNLVDNLVDEENDPELNRLNKISDDIYDVIDWKDEKLVASWRDTHNQMTKHVRENYQKEIAELGKEENWMGFMPSTEIVVTRRDGKETRVDAILNNLFDADGGRDG